LIVEYVDQHEDEFGVEPICAALRDTPARIAPSTYYARKSRPPSGRTRADTELTATIGRVHTENFGVYGVVKMHAQLARLGVTNPATDRPVARWPGAPWPD
jgi:putative transposase